jgi:hypothetical protein
LAQSTVVVLFKGIASGQRDVLSKIVNRWVKDITRVSREIPGLSFASAVQGKHPRDRSNSVKRKNSTENLTNTKSARISTECPHLKVIDENKSMLARTLESISDTKVMIPP